MIRGFEEQTHELTNQELEKVGIVIKGLQTKRGKEMAITGAVICRAMDLKGPRLRKIINHIRIYNLLPALCSTSKGYFIAVNSKELEDYLISLRERISAQISVLNSLEKQSIIFGGSGQTTNF